jgi:hypothetical protein
MAQGDKSAENGKLGGRPKGTLAAKTLAKREAEAKVLQKHALTAQRVLEEIALHSFSNVQDLFDEAGNLKPIHTLTRAQAAAISSFEVIKKNAEAGDGVTDVVHKVRVVDKLKTLELLAKHFALLTEKLDVKGEFTFGWKGTPPEGKP